MSAAKDPYVKVYYRIADDDRFETIYNNDAHLATWLRLLILADGTWPASAPLPQWCKKASLNALVGAGLVELGTGYRYRIHGMDAERSRTAQHASRAANERWSGNAVSNAPSTAQTMPLNSAQLSSTQLSANALAPRKNGLEPIGSIIPDALDANADVVRLQRLAEELTGQAYVMQNVHSGFGAKAVQEQLNRHRFDATERAWRQIANRAKAEGASLPTLKQLVLGADDVLNPVPRRDEKEHRAEDEQASFDRRVAKTSAYLKTLKPEPAA